MNTVKDNVELLKTAADEGYRNTLQLGELNLRTWQKLAEKQMDAFGLWVDAGVRQMELASKAKDYKDYMTSQVELARELGEGLMGKSRETLELAGKARDEYRSLFEKTVKTASESWGKAAPKAQ